MRRQPYRGDGIPRRDPEKYVLREKSLFKRVLSVLVFAAVGAAIGYLPRIVFQWKWENATFASVLLLVVAIIAYFAKEDLEKIDIHDVDEIIDAGDDDEPR